MKATEQQKACVQAAKDHNGVVIEACAGAAKTTTLVLIAKEVKEPSLYWAFNKSAAMEGAEKFPRHVTCKTQHSIAYAVTGLELAHKLSRPKGGYVNVAGTGSEIAKTYGLDGELNVITAAGVGQLVKQTVAAYEQSADRELGVQHLPYTEIKRVMDKGMPDLKRVVLGAAKQLWKDRINVNKKTLATHDTYLKLFQLSEPELDYERIYLDEAQDTTPCVLDIFLRQKKAKLVMVGDSRQNIYSWRGSINAMGMVNFQRQNLGQSFRYGQAVADVAYDILKGKASIKGYDKIESKVGREDVVNREEPHTILYRTNSALLIDAVDALQRGEEVAIEIDVKDFVKLLISAQALYNKDLKGVKHERIVPYTDWQSLCEEAEQDPELRRVVESIAGGRGPMMIELLEYYTMPDEPMITFTTSHKAKGREWDQVILADDFPSHYGKDGKFKGLSESEENLLYVAATRAKLVLEYNQSVEEAIGFMKNARTIREVYGKSGEDMAQFTNEQQESYLLSEGDEYYE